MIDISIDSTIFILLLLIAPLLMMPKTNIRRWIFLFVNLLIFLLSFKSFESLSWAFAFILFPYTYILIYDRIKISVSPYVVLLLAAFIYLKSYTWILGPVIGYDNIRIIPIIGLSYILFRQIDVLLQYNAGYIKKIDLVDYLNYLLSFWTLLAGPIQRYIDFQSSFKKVHVEKFDWKRTLKLFHRAANGMIKIVIIAVLLKKQSDKSFLLLTQGTDSIIPFLCWFYLYPLYVFFNFSGYCDVVIALAGWSGFDIPENFNRPYLARNMVDFWNRWHITLSQWIRDFVYQPLFKILLTHVFKGKLYISQYISISFTFFIVGIWHGTTINFVVFGLLHGVGMFFSIGYKDLLKKFFGKKHLRKINQNKYIKLIGIILCMHFVCFTFLFFEYDFEKILLALCLLSK